MKTTIVNKFWVNFGQYYVKSILSWSSLNCFHKSPIPNRPLLKIETYNISWTTKWILTKFVSNWCFQWVLDAIGQCRCDISFRGFLVISACYLVEASERAGPAKPELRASSIPHKDSINGPAKLRDRILSFLPNSRISISSQLLQQCTTRKVR